MDEQTQLELEAAAFRRMVSHFRERTDVQNIDLMKLAGFCRNCLSTWYREAAEEHADVAEVQRLRPSAGVAEHLTCPGIDIQDLVALGINKKDGVVAVIKDLVESILGPAELLLGLLETSDCTLQLSDAHVKPFQFVGELRFRLL